MKPNTINEHKKGNGIWYSQIEDVGKTIAHFSGCEYNLIKFIYGVVKKNSNFNVYFSDDVYEKMKLRKEYKASSQVNYAGGDTFDSEEGCIIAKEKVMDKYHRDFDNGIREFLKEIRNIEAALQFYCDKHGISYHDLDYPESTKLNKYRNYYGCDDGCYDCCCEDCKF